MRLGRVFTAQYAKPEHFKHAVPMESSRVEELEVPLSWSLEAADAFRDALALRIPTDTFPVEENTIPSWLWSRRAYPGAKMCAEKNVKEVFSRIVGAATYHGWKAGLWNDEEEARVFFDEARAALLSRRLVFSPRNMAGMGLDWAYGLSVERPSPPLHIPMDALVLQNESIDAILSHGEPSARNKWSRFCETSRNADYARVVFADTIAEWNALPSSICAPRAQINMMSFRQDDGTIDVSGIEQAARLAVLLMSLHEAAGNWAEDPAWPLALGVSNMAALLMSVALAYDSEAGRATAAALMAIVTGTATSASAELAAQLGPCPAFAVRREVVMRTLRNRLRASFGEENDYEKISITPGTIRIESGADLVLISAARHACELAVEAAQRHGLRHLQVTTLFAEDSMAALLDSSATGIEVESALVRDYAHGDGTFIRTVHPALLLGMEKLGHDLDDCEAVAAYLVGARTLMAAPGVNRTALREKGFDDAALARLESSLARISHLRQAFTPWALGLDFCRETLRIPEELLKDLRFDVLRYLGFSPREISAASIFCCGHASVRGSMDLDDGEHAIFVTREDLSPEAQIKMAAAVQPFVDGDTDLTISVPAAVVGDVRSAMLMMAWRTGLKCITLHRDGPPMQAAGVQTTIGKRSGRSHQIVPVTARKKISYTAGTIDPAKARAASSEARRKLAGKDKG